MNNKLVVRIATYYMYFFAALLISIFAYSVSVLQKLNFNIFFLFLGVLLVVLIKIRRQIALKVAIVLSLLAGIVMFFVAFGTFDGAVPPAGITRVIVLSAMFLFILMPLFCCEPRKE